MITNGLAKLRPPIQIIQITSCRHWQSCIGRPVWSAACQQFLRELLLSCAAGSKQASDTAAACCDRRRRPNGTIWSAAAPTSRLPPPGKAGAKSGPQISRPLPVPFVSLVYNFVRGNCHLTSPAKPVTRGMSVSESGKSLLHTV